MTYHEALGLKQRKTEEEQIQCALVERLRLQAPPEIIFYHCPNGGKRGKATGGKLKAMGVLRGVPDLCFILAAGSPAFLELKRKGGTVDNAQNEFAEKCAFLGVEHAVAYGIDQAVSILTAWGCLPE